MQRAKVMHRHLWTTLPATLWTTSINPGRLA